MVIKIKSFLSAVFVLAALVTFILPSEPGGNIARADEGETTEPADSNRFEAMDAGVDSIDISKYPKEMQGKYETVKVKCAHCHTLARVINSNYALEDEWKRYIKRMRRKPGSGIKKADAKEIWEFLVYDSKQRKADLIKKKTEAQTKDDK